MHGSFDREVDIAPHPDPNYPGSNSKGENLKCDAQRSDSAIKEPAAQIRPNPNTHEGFGGFDEDGVLHSVPIIVESESNLSSGHSVSIESVFDSVFGLFSVKPKYLKYPKTQKEEDGSNSQARTAEELSEAGASLEVSENLGIFFDAEKEAILEKFIEIGKDVKS
ncbi:hypothetical protein V6N13_133899 [Hibiscus sabdariffa]